MCIFGEGGNSVPSNLVAGFLPEYTMHRPSRARPQPTSSSIVGLRHPKQYGNFLGMTDVNGASLLLHFLSLMHAALLFELDLAGQ